MLKYIVSIDEVPALRRGIRESLTKSKVKFLSKITRRPFFKEETKDKGLSAKLFAGVSKAFDSTDRVEEIHRGWVMI